MVANLGSDAINMLSQCEKAGTHLTGGLLRATFEGLIIPDDQQTLINRLSLQKGKLTGTLLRDTAAHIKEERMWRWLICHRQMSEEKVHPSRSVFCSLLLLCTVFWAG